MAAFNDGRLDALTAAQRLHLSPARLYQLRHQWLQNHRAFQPQPSGGNHRAPWPQGAHDFLAEFLPHSQPLNFALVADELARRFDFHRSRPAVADYVRQHFPQLVASQRTGPKPRRRWQCAAIGELWQHDSSPHPWWPADTYPTLILTADDHSRKIVAGSFVPSDTTWSHFTHLRPPLEQHGPPATLYTDGLSLFGHRSCNGARYSVDAVAVWIRGRSTSGCGLVCGNSAQKRGQKFAWRGIGHPSTSNRFRRSDTVA